MEIDHVFVWVRSPEQAAERLKSAGLIEGEPNDHPGQGTANRRFFFSNAMLELLYLTNQAELHAERTAASGLAEQFDDAAKSPVGIVLRPSAQDSAQVPFAANPYFPRYLPEGLHMDIGIGTYAHEPNYIYLGFARRRHHRSAPGHALDGQAVDTITRFIVHQAGAAISAVGRQVLKIPAFAIAADGRNALELELNQGQMGRRQDFQPDIPLMLSW